MRRTVIGFLPLGISISVFVYLCITGQAIHNAPLALLLSFGPFIWMGWYGGKSTSSCAVCGGDHRKDEPHEG